VRSGRPAEPDAAGWWPQPPPEVLDRLAELGPDGAWHTVAPPRPGELLGQLAGRTLEAALEAEMTEHLGHPPGGRPQGANVRNGAVSKTVHTDLGPVEVTVPRDRDGSFVPRVLPKRQTRLAGVDNDTILGLYAGGMTVHDVGSTLDELYGTRIGGDALPRIADAVLDDVRGWRTRALDPVYPVVSFETMRVKVHEDRSVQGGGCLLALGVTGGGERELLGIWQQATDLAAPWLAVLDDLRRRGVEDIVIGRVDDPTSGREAIEATFPRAWVQTRTSDDETGSPSPSGRPTASPISTVGARATEPRLWTIGYERLRPPELIAELEAAGVERLLDVRFRPQSRRSGMSKTRLGAHLAEHGIAYEHRRGLGTPPEIRWYFKYSRVAEGRERYAAHLRAQPELVALADELPSAPRTALLCLEADPAACHRRVIAELLAERIPGLRVTDL